MTEPALLSEYCASIQDGCDLSVCSNGPDNVTVFEPSQKETAWLTVPTSSGWRPRTMPNDNYIDGTERTAQLSQRSESRRSSLEKVDCDGCNGRGWRRFGNGRTDGPCPRCGGNGVLIRSLQPDTDRSGDSNG